MNRWAAGEEARRARRSASNAVQVASGSHATGEVWIATIESGRLIGASQARTVLPTLAPAADAGIEPVAQPVAEQVESEDREPERESGERREPPRLPHVAACVGHHRAPLGGRRLRAQAEEAE